MKRTAAIGLICIVILLIAAWLLNAPGGRQAQLLPDGSTLCLTGLKFGATNTFRHGTLVEKLLGPILPSNGLAVGSMKLARPANLNFETSSGTSLTAEFRLRPSPSGMSELLGGQENPPKFRWTITGNDMRYMVELRGFMQHKEGVFSYLSTSRFPWESRRLKIGLEERSSDNSNWHPIASFDVRNATAPRIRSWTSSPIPVTKRVDEVDFTLGETTFRAEPRYSNDILSCKVELPFQVRRQGVVETNWSADFLRFEDASGNSDQMGALKTATNGWLICTTWRGLDPNHVWRIKADFGLDSGWQATNLCTVHIPVSLNSPIKTNFNGVPLQIDLINGDMLAVKMRTNRTDLRLTFVDANDGGGPFRAGSWNQHGFRKKLELPPGRGTQTNSTIEATPMGHWIATTGPGGGPQIISTIEATFAVDRNYHVEFYTKPIVVKTSPDFESLAPKKPPGTPSPGK